MGNNILVTGGTGYIGSHIVVELLNSGYDVTILDNLSNSKIDVLDKIERITNKRPIFYQIDLLDFDSLNHLFEISHFDLVIHLAGLKAIAESIEKPLLYYENNISGTLNLLQSMKKHRVKNLIFSSSAAVYGTQNVIEYTEDLPTGLQISSPYGKTKYIIEEILKDLATSDSNFNIISLRYFNPIGNHKSGLIGENPNNIPNNLMPYVIKVARRELPILSIYGNDYDTADGTCERDFIHVVDLAKGHLAAISALKPGFDAFNLGTGHPTSVQQIVNTFERVSGTSLPHQFVARRPGDLPKYFANPQKANQTFHWHATLTIEDSIKDTLAFINHQ